MYFYSVDSLMVAMVALAAFLAIRQSSVFPNRSARIALALEVLSVPIALVFSLAVTHAVDEFAGWTFTATAFSIAYALTALDIVRRTRSRFLARAIGVSVSFMVSVSFILSVSGSPSALQALSCVVAGLCLFAGGVAWRTPTASVAGVITVIAGFVFGLEAMLALVMSSSWIELAIFGACAIATGSVIERHGAELGARLKRGVSQWTVRDKAIALEN